MKIKEEREVEKEQKQQEAWERKKEVNRERAMIERKCFVFGGFKHIAHNCRNVENRRQEESTSILSNKFEVLNSKVINIEKENGRKIRKDRKMILKEEKLKEKRKDQQKVRKIKRRKNS